MINLILAIASSCLISILMRLGDKYIKNNMVMFMANYIVCTGLSAAFMGGSLNASTEGKGLIFALLLGVISGVLYLGTFILMQLNIKKNGVVLTATFMKLGVLVPTIMAVAVFGEQLKVLQIIGIVLAVAAIILMNGFRDDGSPAAGPKSRPVSAPDSVQVSITESEPDPVQESTTASAQDSVSISTTESRLNPVPVSTTASEQAPVPASTTESRLNSVSTTTSEPNSASVSKSASASGLLLIILLIVGGITDSFANIYDEQGAAAYKDHYLLFVFASACIFSIIMIFVRKQHFTWMDMLWGMMIGVPNYFSSRFLLGALGEMPAVVVYPVYNVAAILIICLFGMAVFKEKPGLRKLIGIGVIVVGLVCLNI